MTAGQAYLSFARFVEQQLSTLLPDVTVSVEKPKLPVPPYVSIEYGGVIYSNQYIARCLCQLRLTLRAVDTEPLVLTIERYQKLIFRAIHDQGQLQKYDFTTDPPTPIGGYSIQVDNWSPDLSEIANESQTVLSVYLTTHAKS